MYGGFFERHKEEQREIFRSIHAFAEQAYIEGCTEGVEQGHNDSFGAYKDGYKKGLETAWECARKLCQSEKYGGLQEHCADIFDIHDRFFDVFDFSVDEAIDKVREYETKHKHTDKGCESCKYEDEPEFTCPCVDCSRNHKDMWEAKR